MAIETSALRLASHRGATPRAASQRNVFLPGTGTGMAIETSVLRIAARRTAPRCIATHRNVFFFAAQLTAALRAASPRNDVI